ncbi:hypothetical protein NE237_022926 [Protea cynaroides]|uniref:LOB domain-containing protein n=1 Tax=Protea cynaroides TaxID=273540 RepID=A0A9Q0K4X7_9MAGN|nr:hypothetical protein NE237_022926 [Protea cynaroides]
MASSSNSPCAACKFLRRKCTQECVFAPYFPPDQPTKFANVHKVFGASNVAKLLNELNPTQREDAVNSLAYEAEARLRDPVYGCVGLISILQHRLKQVQHDLNNAKKELANYIGPSAMLPLSHQHHQLLHPHSHHNPSSNTGPYGMSPVGLGLPAAQTQAQVQLLLREQQQQQHHQQMLEAQHLAAVVAAREQQEMLRSYAQQQQQEELVSSNNRNKSIRISNIHTRSREQRAMRLRTLIRLLELWSSSRLSLSAWCFLVLCSRFNSPHIQIPESS